MDINVYEKEDGWPVCPFMGEFRACQADRENLGEMDSCPVTEPASSEKYYELFFHRPEECPLNQGPIIVSLQKKENDEKPQ